MLSSARCGFLCHGSSIEHSRNFVYCSITRSFGVLSNLGCNALASGVDLLTKLVAVGVECLDRRRSELLSTLGNSPASFSAIVYHRIDYFGGGGCSCFHKLTSFFLQLRRAGNSAALFVCDFAQKRTVFRAGTGRKKQACYSANSATDKKCCELAHMEHLPQKIV